MLHHRTFLKDLGILLFVLAPTLMVSECLIDSDPGPQMTTCACTGQMVYTTSCQYGYSGEDCTYQLPGNYCGSSGTRSCYVGYAVSTSCSQAPSSKKAASLRDGLGADFGTVREANLPRCGGDPAALRSWLEKAPGFPARKSSQSAGL